MSLFPDMQRYETFVSDQIADHMQKLANAQVCNCNSLNIPSLPPPMGQSNDDWSLLGHRVKIKVTLV